MGEKKWNKDIFIKIRAIAEKIHKCNVSKMFPIFLAFSKHLLKIKSNKIPDLIEKLSLAVYYQKFNATIEIILAIFGVLQSDQTAKSHFNRMHIRERETQNKRYKNAVRCQTV